MDGYINRKLKNNYTDFDVHKLLDGVLEGIDDIIAVYRTDNTILFYNKAGYEFYKTTPEEAKGKRCWEMLNRNCRCTICTKQLALQKGKLVRIEKYMPELDKFMECTANPVYDEDGRIALIIEQLRDVTEKKKNELLVKQSEERYRSLVELSPDAIVVVQDETIQMANEACSRVFGFDKLVGMNVFDLLHIDHREAARSQLDSVLNFGIPLKFTEYKITHPQGGFVYVEAASNRLLYNERPAIQIVMRNITERKSELARAARMQQQRFEFNGSQTDKADMSIFYVPAEDISGDFYHLNKEDNGVMIGIVGDVSGKGISAALNVSAMKILFFEALERCQEPDDILHYMNSKLSHHLAEDYVAACCFKIDFNKGQLKLACAAMNEFMIKNESGLHKYEIPGAFLGMFKDSTFECQSYDIHFKDILYFYSDGFQLVKDESNLEAEMGEAGSIEATTEKIESQLGKIGVLKDDCTLVAIKIL